MPETPSASEPRVVLLTRAGCHLCEDAETVVRQVCADATTYRIVDVDSDPSLRATYTDHVPVTLVDGRVLSYWFLDAASLSSAIAAPR